MMHLSLSREFLFTSWISPATSAMTATLFSNPLEVVKTRFQLQGELRAKGLYTVHYKNFFHAMYVIAKVDGISALQKGLVPALWHQLFMNGIRLSVFQMAEERKLNLKSNGEISLLKTCIIAAVMGGITAYTGSPFYLVKIQLQAQSSKRIAVGTQHDIHGTFSTLHNIYKSQGLTGLWRGCTGSLPRRSIGSATQLGSFTACKDLLAKNEVYSIPKGHLNSFLASMIGGVAVSIVMCPLDTISTRLYNQGVDSKGKGLLYSSYFDCVKKMFNTEGLTSFYKGLVPLYIRTGPQTVLVLVIWDALKGISKNVKQL